jgi:Protein of unknown function (DUF2510)
VARPQYPPPPLLEPGWYQDPTARFEARYWDGGHWTSHISHYGATGSDPLLAARFDRVWIRWTARLVAWGLLIGLGWWAVDRFWPTDERDLVAEEELLGVAALEPGDLPVGFNQAIEGDVSPLFISEGDLDDGVGEACADLMSSTDDLDGDPKSANGFGTALGSLISNSTVVTAADDDAAAYLESLVATAAGDCLGALWQRRHRQAEPDVALVATARSMGEPSFGDRAVWWRMEGERNDGSSFDSVFADIIVVQVGRVASQYTFEGVGEAIGVDVHRRVIGPHVERLGDELAGIDEPDDSGG